MKNLNQKGITIISLVITIIVLAILSVSIISNTIGIDGIVEKTTASKESYQVKEDREIIEISKQEIAQKNNGDIPKTPIQEKLEEIRFDICDQNSYEELKNIELNENEFIVKCREHYEHYYKVTPDETIYLGSLKDIPVITIGNIDISSTEIIIPITIKCENGLKNITLPDNTKIEAKDFKNLTNSNIKKESGKYIEVSFTYTVYVTGNYKFKAMSTSNTVSTRIVSIGNQEIQIKLNPTDWTNQTVLATVENGNSNTQIKVVNLITGKTIENWHSATEYTAYQNCIIYAREQVEGNISIKTVNIQNIDKLQPNNVKITIPETTINSFKLNIVAKDQEAKDTDGKSGIKELKYYITKGETIVKQGEFKFEQDKQDFNKIIDIEGLEVGTKYGYYVEVTDYAGNTYSTKKESNPDEITTLNQYNIVYHGNGGTTTDGQDTFIEVKTEGKSIKIQNNSFVKTGYNFKEWNTKADGTGTKYNPNNTYYTDSKLDLYAIWEIKTIKVTFMRNLDSSDTTSATQTFTYGVAGQKFSDKGWTKEGYTQLGWSTDRNATTRQYLTLSGVSNSWINTNSPAITLYAVWAKAYYQNTTTNINYITLNEAVTGSATGTTIKVLDNKEETTTGTIPSNKNLTLDLNGKTITFNGKYNIYNQGTLTITGSGKITGKDKSTIDNTGTLNVNMDNETGYNNGTGGIIANTSPRITNIGIHAINSTGTVNINSGIVANEASADEISTSYAPYAISSSGTLSIKGGIVRSISSDVATQYGIWTKGTLNMSGGTIEAVGTAVYTGGTGNLTITGGTIKTGGTANTSGRTAINHKSTGNLEINGTSLVNISSKFEQGIINQEGTVTVNNPNATIQGKKQSIYNVSSGKINVNNGTLITATNDAIRNNGTGIVNITGGTLTGVNYAVYNYAGGEINVSGGTLTSSKYDGIRNVAGGKNTITGGTITGNNHGIFNDTESAPEINIMGGKIKGTNECGIVLSKGKLTLGKNDETVSTTVPIIEAKKIGINASNAEYFNFYDGIVKGATAINGTVTATPTGYRVVTSTVDGIQSATLSNKYIITYNANGGTVTPTSKQITYGDTYGELPIPTKEGHTFIGWYTEETNGTKIESTTKFTLTTDQTIYAHYTANQYAVTYNYTENGGTNATIKSANVAYGKEIDLTPTATKEGYTFVGWNTNKDATTGLEKLTMGTNNVTLYAIYKKEITVTYKYYNNQTTTEKKTIYNKTTNSEITLKGELGTPSGYTFRGWSTSENADATVLTETKITLTSNTTYYASYQKTVTATFHYCNANGNIYTYKYGTTTADGTQYLSYKNEVKNTNITIPDILKNNGNYYNVKYKGVAITTSSTTSVTPTTGNTIYYAFYQGTITYYYYNGSAHTSSTATRTITLDGTKPVCTVDKQPTPSAYDGATYKGWTISNTSINGNTRTPNATSSANLYAYYQKTVTATFNYYNGTAKASTTAEAIKTYISKAVNTTPNIVNSNITIPDVVKENRTINNVEYTYRGVSTSDVANAEVITPTTANETYYASYTYPIEIDFDANGGTGTAPAKISQNGYMKYEGSKTGIEVTIPTNPFTKAGYTKEQWNDKQDGTGTKYSEGTNQKFTESKTIYTVWKINTLKFTGTGSKTHSFKTGYLAQKACSVPAILQVTIPEGGYSIVASVGGGMVTFNGPSGTKTIINSSSGTANYDITENGYLNLGYFASVYITVTSTGEKVPLEFEGYEVSFNMNGGMFKNDPSILNQIVKIGESIGSKATETLSKNTTRAGYTLIGWSEDSNATAATYAAEEKITPTKDMTLYAVWQIRTLEFTGTGNKTYTVDKGSLKAGVYGANLSITIPEGGYTVSGTANAGPGTAQVKFVNSSGNETVIASYAGSNVTNSASITMAGTLILQRKF